MKEVGDLVSGPDTVARSETGERLQRLVGRILFVAALGLIVIGLAERGVRAAGSSGDRAAGAELFRAKGCEHCHGPDGVGTVKAPSLMTVGKRLNKSQIEHQILEGGKQMPPFDDVLSQDEARKLVEYLAHKKKAPKEMPRS